MQRIACDERPDWRDRAEEVGFDFHTIDGAPYWDESAYYGFTLEQIERDIEAPTAELDGMCRELVARAVDDERMLRVLHIPERFWTYIAASWKRSDPSLYGRFDLRYDAQGPAKLLEYNADTPAKATLGGSYVRKPLYSREGGNIEMVVDGTAVDADTGPFGAEGFVWQGLAPLPQFSGNYTVLGSWIAADKACGLSIREDASPITKNTSRFLPHAIIA